MKLYVLANYLLLYNTFTRSNRYFLFRIWEIINNTFITFQQKLVKLRTLIPRLLLAQHFLPIVTTSFDHHCNVLPFYIVVNNYDILLNCPTHFRTRLFLLEFMLFVQRETNKPFNLHHTITSLRVYLLLLSKATRLRCIKTSGNCVSTRS